MLFVFAEAENPFAGTQLEFTEEGGRDRSNDAEVQHVNVPCTSTGFWFINPTLASIEFYKGLLDTMLHKELEVNEQIVYNEV